MLFRSREFDNLGVADLAIISAVILAPLVEEMMFRGLLQRWCIDFLARRPKTRPLTLEPAGGLLLTTADGAMGVEEEVWPDLIPSVASVPNSTRSPTRACVILGIIITSVSFAAVHAPQWPAPIPLFALAMIIGFVYHRTGSLISAVCMHATFNGFSTLAMFVAILAGHEKEARKAIDGRWRPSVVAVMAHPSACGAIPDHALGKNRNSERFLVDESVPD